MKKTLRAAAAVALTGTLLQANCLSINASGLNRTVNDLLGNVLDGVTPALTDFVTETITDLLP